MAALRVWLQQEQRRTGALCARQLDAIESLSQKLGAHPKMQTVAQAVRAVVTQGEKVVLSPAATGNPLRIAYPSFHGTRDEELVSIMKSRLDAFSLLLGGVPSFDDETDERDERWRADVVAELRRKSAHLNGRLVSRTWQRISLHARLRLVGSSIDKARHAAIWASRSAPRTLGRAPLARAGQPKPASRGAASRYFQQPLETCVPTIHGVSVTTACCATWACGARRTFSGSALRVAR